MLYMYICDERKESEFLFKQVDELSLLDNELAILRAGLP